MNSLNDHQPQSYFVDNQRLLQQKNQLIEQLQSQVSKQQKQIQKMFNDSRINQIQKYDMISLQKYMKNEKYLLVRIDNTENNFLFLSKYAKIVNFGQLQLLGIQRLQTPKGMRQGKSYDSDLTINTYQGFDEHEVQECRQNIAKKFTKGLQTEVQALRQKIMKYSNLVDKSITKSKKKDKQDKLEITQVESIIKKIDQTPQAKKGSQNYDEQQKEFQSVNVSNFPSPSPLKKRNNTKTIIVRKR